MVMVAVTGLPQEVPGLANMEILKTAPRASPGLAPLPSPHMQSTSRYDVMLDYDYDYLRGDGHDSSSDIIITTLERPVISEPQLSTDFTDYAILPLSNEKYSDSTDPNLTEKQEGRHSDLLPETFPSKEEMGEMDVVERLPSEISDQSLLNKEFSALDSIIKPSVSVEIVDEFDIPQEADTYDSDASRQQSSRIERAKSQDLELVEYDLALMNVDQLADESVNFETVVPAPLNTVLKYTDGTQASVSRSLDTRHDSSRHRFINRGLSVEHRELSKLNTKQTYADADYFDDAGDPNHFTAKNTPTHTYQSEMNPSKRFDTETYSLTSEGRAYERLDKRVLEYQDHTLSSRPSPSFKTYYLSGTQEPRASPFSNPALKNTRENHRYLRSHGKVPVPRPHSSGSTVRDQTSSRLPNSISLDISKPRYPPSSGRIPFNIDPRNRDEVLYYTGLQKEIEKSELLLDAIRDVRSREGKAIASNIHKTTTTTTITPVPDIDDVRDAFGGHPLYDDLPRDPHPIKHREQYDSESDEYENLYLPVRAKSLELRGIQEVKDNFDTFIPKRENRPQISPRYPPRPYPNTSYPTVTTFKPSSHPKYTRIPSLLASPTRHPQHSSPSASSGRPQSKTGKDLHSNPLYSSTTEHGKPYSSSTSPSSHSTPVYKSSSSHYTKSSTLTTSQTHRPYSHSSTSFRSQKSSRPNNHQFVSNYKPGDSHSLKSTSTRDQRSLSYTTKETPKYNPRKKPTNPVAKYSSEGASPSTLPRGHSRHLTNTLYLPTNSQYHHTKRLYHPTTNVHHPTNSHPKSSRNQSTRHPDFSSTDPHYATSTIPHPISSKYYPNEHLDYPTRDQSRPTIHPAQHLIYPHSSQYRSTKQADYPTTVKPRFIDGSTSSHLSTNLNHPTSLHHPTNLHHPIKRLDHPTTKLQQGTSDLKIPSTKLHHPTIHPTSNQFHPTKHPDHSTGTMNHPIVSPNHPTNLHSPTNLRLNLSGLEGRVRQKRGPDMNLESHMDANFNFPKFGYDIDPYFQDFPVFGFFEIDPLKER